MPIAENATPITWSMTAGVPEPSKVVIETVLAAWAVAALVSPVTGHTMAVDDVPANGVVKVITRIALLHVTVAAPALVVPFKMQTVELVTEDVTKLVPATVIVLIKADVAGVKVTVPVTPVEAATLVDNVTKALYIAENATPITWSMTAGVPEPSKVVIETVLAAWAVAALVSPVTGHTMAVDDVPANGVVKVITRIALLHVTVAAPALVVPFKMQTVELVTEDVTKLIPATAIVLIKADVAGVNATVATTPVVEATLVDSVKTA